MSARSCLMCGPRSRRAAAAFALSAFRCSTRCLFGWSIRSSRLEPSSAILCRSPCEYISTQLNTAFGSAISLTPSRNTRGEPSVDRSMLNLKRSPERSSSISTRAVPPSIVARIKPLHDGPSCCASVVVEFSNISSMRLGSQPNTNRIISTMVDLQVPRAPMMQVSFSSNRTGASPRKPAETASERTCNRIHCPHTWTDRLLGASKVSGAVKNLQRPSQIAYVPRGVLAGHPIHQPL